MKNIKGFVKVIRPDLGYGFVYSPIGDTFCHLSQNAALIFMKPGDPVVFDLDCGGKYPKPRAINLRAAA